MIRFRMPAALVAVVAGAALTITSAPAQAVGDKDCSDFASQKAAQIFFLNHGGPQSDPHGLDAEGDGIACESNPAPYYYGTSLPGGGGGGDSQPAPQVTVVKSAVRLVLDPAKAIKGERYDMSITVRPTISRTVWVQRKVNGRWKAFARGVTGTDGKTSGHFRVPAEDAVFRAVLREVKKGTKKYTAANSDTENIRIQQQRIALSFADNSLAEGDSARATAKAFPARPGRKIEIQIEQPGGWRTVRTFKENRHGAGTVTLPETGLGEYRYRAVVQRHEGAAARASAERTVTVDDVTPPPTPGVLQAVAGDASVMVSWAAVSADDLSHYIAWGRPEGSQTWTMLGTTTDTSMLVGQLTNGVTYWFTVTSVDVHDNESDAATETSAVPMAPEPPTTP